LYSNVQLTYITKMSGTFLTAKLQRQLLRATAVGAAVRALHGTFALDRKLALDVALALAVDLGLDAAYSALPGSTQQGILEAGGASTTAAAAATETVEVGQAGEPANRPPASTEQPRLEEPRPPIRFRRL